MSIFNNVLGAINTGLGVYGGVQSAQQQGNAGACRAPAGCFQCKMTGQGDIAGCLDRVLNGGIYLMLVNGQIPNAEVLNAFQQVLNGISNPSYFKQTDSYVQQAIQVLQGAIQRYQTTNLNSGTTPTGTNPTGAITGGASMGNVPASSPIVSGVPNSYLFIGGVAILGLI
jgi:hypothetical protein